MASAPSQAPAPLVYPAPHLVHPAPHLVRLAPPAPALRPVHQALLAPRRLSRRLAALCLRPSQSKRQLTSARTSTSLVASLL